MYLCLSRWQHEFKTNMDSHRFFHQPFFFSNDNSLCPDSCTNMYSHQTEEWITAAGVLLLKQCEMTHPFLSRPTGHMNALCHSAVPLFHLAPAVYSGHLSVHLGWVLQPTVRPEAPCDPCSPSQQAPWPDSPSEPLPTNPVWQNQDLSLYECLFVHEQALAALLTNRTRLHVKQRAWLFLTMVNMAGIHWRGKIATKVKQLDYTTGKSLLTFPELCNSDPTRLVPESLRNLAPFRTFHNL